MVNPKLIQNGEHMLWIEGFLGTSDNFKSDILRIEKPTESLFRQTDILGTGYSPQGSTIVNRIELRLKSGGLLHSCIYPQKHPLRVVRGAIIPGNMHGGDPIQLFTLMSSAQRK